MTLKYATTLQLAEIIGVVKEIPSWDIAATPTNEAVGTGNNVLTEFYLDRKNIATGNYTFYASGSPLTETTHFVLDKDNGKITLTTSGVTTLGVGAFTAKYKYIDMGMAESHLTSVLERAEAEVDNLTNTTFTNGTATNPAYPHVTEIKPSAGYFNDQIIVDKKPLIDVSTTLSGSLTSSGTSISLLSGTGALFPSSGTIVLGSEAITYTGVSTDSLTGCTRGALGTTGVTHSDGDEIHTTALFMSNTIEGTAVDWTLQPWDTGMYASGNGLVYDFGESVLSVSQYPDRLTKQDVANRIKILYHYGNDSIPADITRLTLLLAKRQLVTDNIGKSMIAGRNEFRPEMLNADESEIRMITGSYVVLPMGNT